MIFGQEPHFDEEVEQVLVEGAGRGVRRITLRSEREIWVGSLADFEARSSGGLLRSIGVTDESAHPVDGWDHRTEGGSEAVPGLFDRFGVELT